MEEVRVRFAPSPTGYLHIGGARTCLFNWLFAKSQGGKLVLRIEDTDQERLKEDSVSQIITSLKWLGLSWDEGPEVGGDKGPYYQSQRLDIYKKVCEQLVAQGKAYYCFCTPEDLEKDRERQRELKQPFRYSGTCRNLTAEQVKEKIANGEKYSVRFKLPEQKNVVVHDLIHGDVTFTMDQFDDFVIMKTNGIPTYNFAVVVDDHAMNITHVLRAEEHLSNTPKQIFIYEALGYPVPKFGHMPMILAPDRSKLSKRHGATSVEEFRQQGYLPEAIVNYLTLLGWSPGNDQEIFTLPETLKQFDFAKMSKKAAVYDTKKLTWLNGQYLSSLPIDNIVQAVIPFFKQAGYIDDKYLAEHGDYFTHLVDVVRVRVKTLQEVVEGAEYFFKPVTSYDPKGEAKHFTTAGADILEKCIAALTALPDFTLASTEAAYNKVAEEMGLSLGKVVHPTRLALTGRTVSPGLFDVMILLGKDETVKRLTQAVSYIKNK